MLTLCSPLLDKNPSPILSVIQPVSIDTMLNNNGLNNGHGLKNVTYKQGKFNDVLLDGYWLRLTKVTDLSCTY